MKHTPGPWTLIKEGDRCEELKVIGPEQKGSFYPKTIANAGIVYGAEDVANFALIAAAPKMLSALEKVAEFIRDQYECHEAQALEGGYLSEEAEPIWAIISEAIADARAGESDAS